MRKKLYLIVIIVIIGITSCQIDEIDLYDSPSFISFTQAEKDTMTLSFLLLGNLDEYDCPIVVQHTGIPSNEKKEFKVSLVTKYTDMKSGFYSIPTKLTFKPMSKLDTFYIKLTNYAELKTEKALLCIELEESQQLLLGDRNYRRLYIQINDNVAKPDWWTDDIVKRYFLGTYSDTKFRLLIQVVKPDLSNTSNSYIRSWALQLKNYLDENPTQDEDGSLMTVTVKK